MASLLSYVYPICQLCAITDWELLFSLLIAVDNLTNSQVYFTLRDTYR